MPDGTQQAAQELILSLRGLPKQLRPEARKGLRKAAQPILEDARRRASWSSRIPSSLVIRVGFSQRNPGVRIVSRRAVAPHGRVYEGLQRGGNRRVFRHPVFGRDRWVAQATRPFLLPAVMSGRDDVIVEMNRAVARSARAAGWRITGSE